MILITALSLSMQSRSRITRAPNPEVPRYTLARLHYARPTRAPSPSRWAPHAALFVDGTERLAQQPGRGVLADITDKPTTARLEGRSRTSRISASW